MYGPVGELFVVAVRQLDLSCPTARSCPGQSGIEAMCGLLQESKEFDCSTTWSAGASGVLSGDLNAVSKEVVSFMEEYCGACSVTLSYSTFRDVVVSEA